MTHGGLTFSSDDLVEVDVTRSCADFDSYRAARTKAMFNVDSGATYSVHAAVPHWGSPTPWNIGLIVGPSGMGKTTIGRELAASGAADWVETPLADWPTDAPIIDGVAPGTDDFDTATGALTAVGLGDVPAWLRPYSVLSTGQKFRADLARLVGEATADTRVVVDEFTSVVDRQIARVGAAAFQKAWRRSGGQAVLLSCHYDIEEWLEPDWVYDLATGTLRSERVQRPSIDVDIVQGARTDWRVFKPHHYLDVGPMPFSVCYVGYVGNEPVAHLGMSSKYLNTRHGKRIEARGCRLVIMPEWQGIGLGTRFLNHVCQMYLDTGGHLGRPCTTQFHTSHPGLSAALSRDPRWRRVSGDVTGTSKVDSVKHMRAARARKGEDVAPSTGGFGGHFRAVRGFRYVGPPKEAQQ